MISSRQVAEEINKDVFRIVEAAQQGSQGVSQTSNVSTELARLGEELPNLVDRFRV